MFAISFSFSQHLVYVFFAILAFFLLSILHGTKAKQKKPDFSKFFYFLQHLVISDARLKLVCNETEVGRTHACSIPTGMKLACSCLV